MSALGVSPCKANASAYTTDSFSDCPHGAFQQRIIREDALPRESIEVRALVFTLPRADEKDTDSA